MWTDSEFPGPDWLGKPNLFNVKECLSKECLVCGLILAAILTLSATLSATSARSQCVQGALTGDCIRFHIAQHATPATTTMPITIGASCADIQLSLVKRALALALALPHYTVIILWGKPISVKPCPFFKKRVFASHVLFWPYMFPAARCQPLNRQSEATIQV